MPAHDLRCPTLPEPRRWAMAFASGPGEQRRWKLRTDPPALHGPSTASPDTPAPSRIPAVATSVPAGETGRDYGGRTGDVEKGERRKMRKGARSAASGDRRRDPVHACVGLSASCHGN